MVLWGRRTSINVQKVMWILAELDVEYERIDVGGTFGGLGDERYMALNPHQKVPTLEDGSVVLWESNAILRYIGCAYGAGSLFGSTAADRGRSDMWMEWFQSSVYSSFQTVFHQTVKLPNVERNVDVLKRAQDDIFRQFALYDSVLESSAYINGDQLTLGDIPMAACLYRYFTMNIDRPDYTQISRYYKCLMQRPAFRENVMIDYESLRSKT